MPVRNSESSDFRKILGNISRQNDFRRTFDSFVHMLYALRPQASEAREQGLPPTPVEVERIKASLVQPQRSFV